MRHDSEVEGSRDSGPRNLSGASGLGQDLTGFAKRYLRQRFFLGGGRGAREIDVDVDEGADNAVQRRISPPGILNILKISSPIGVNISEI